MASPVTEPAVSRAWRYALRLLAARERSEHEVRQRLRERGLSAADADGIVERLRRQGYLDDARFAESMAHRARRRGHGRLRLRADLVARGVARKIAAPIVAAAFADEQELARKILRKRYGTLPSGGPDRARAARFLLQRGFPRRVVLAILKEGC